MSDRFSEIVASTMLIISVATASLAAGVIQRERESLKLVMSMEGVSGMPPHVAVATAALGTFRGLAVDVLWARADALQTAGNYFEAQTLSQWITTLQPRFPKVWAFQAWNLAYNISVSTPVADERWGWVNKGMELLRSQGIPLNPDDASLPMELAWIFFDKLGGKHDREHWYYKVRLAREFRELLGDITGGRTTQDAISRFRIIVDAAESLDELSGDAEASKVLQLIKEHGAEPNEALVRMFGNVSLYAGSLDTQILEGQVLPAGTNRSLLSALIDNPSLAETMFNVVIPHLQKRALLDRYHMNLAFMLEQMERYGPLDWGHPHAHGIYWSELGVSRGRETLRREKINELMIIRTRLLNLLHLTRTGRIEFDPRSDRIDLLPDPRFIEGYEYGMQNAVELIQSAEGVSAAEFGLADIGDLLQGYEAFLQEATVFCYLYGDEAEAAGCFAKLRRIAEEDGRGDEPIYTNGVQGFLAVRLAEVLDIDVSNTRQFLDAMIQRAMLDGLAKGRLDTFNRFVNVAFSVYDRRYSASKPGSVHINREARLPPFPDIVAASFTSAMKQESNPVLVRSRIWAWAPASLREKTWGELADILATHASAVGLAPLRAFPPPTPADENTETADTPSGALPSP